MPWINLFTKNNGNYSGIYVNIIFFTNYAVSSIQIDGIFKILIRCLDI